MEQAYDAILGGDPKAAKEILAKALRLDERKQTEGRPDADGDKATTE